MKIFTATVAILFFAASAFGAIEFSEDQVAASADPSAGTPAAAASGTPGGMPVMSAAGAMAQSQTTGAAGSVGSRPVVVGQASSPDGGGGGTNTGGNNISGGSNGQGGPGGPAAPGDPSSADQAGPDDGDATNAPVPEPSTMVVWSLLGLLGLVALRRRK